MAEAFGVVKLVFVLAVRGQLLATLSMIAVVAHTFRIMFLICVSTLSDYSISSTFFCWYFFNFCLRLFLNIIGDLGDLIELVESLKGGAFGLLADREILLRLLGFFEWHLVLNICVKQLHFDLGFSLTL